GDDHGWPEDFAVPRYRRRIEVRLKRGQVAAVEVQGRCAPVRAGEVLWPTLACGRVHQWAQIDRRPPAEVVIGIVSPRHVEVGGAYPAEPVAVEEEQMPISGYRGSPVVPPAIDDGPEVHRCLPRTRERGPSRNPDVVVPHVADPARAVRDEIEAQSVGRKLRRNVHKWRVHGRSQIHRLGPLGVPVTAVPTAAIIVVAIVVEPARVGDRRGGPGREPGSRGPCLHDDGVARPDPGARRAARRAPIVTARVDWGCLVRAEAQAGLGVARDVIEAHHGCDLWVNYGDTPDPNRARKRPRSRAGAGLDIADDRVPLDPASKV